MVSLAIRKNEVPNSGTLLWLENSTAPLGFNHDANLQNIYFKNVLNACTCPGCTGGGNTHTHASTGSHLHSVPGGHTHNLQASSTSLFSIMCRYTTQSFSP